MNHYIPEKGIEYVSRKKYVEENMKRRKEGGGIEEKLHSIIWSLMRQDSNPAPSFNACFVCLTTIKQNQNQ